MDTMVHNKILKRHLISRDNTFAILNYSHEKLLVLKYYCAARIDIMELIVLSCVRGDHVYGEVWMAVMGEQLFCDREIGNMLD